MDNRAFKPERIKRPFQLLAAWLIGLITIDASFLFSATQISQPTWAPAALIVAAIINVPIFLTSVFLLQTKFRAEMQDDIYYSKYLEYQRTPTVLRTVAQRPERQVQKLSKNIAKEIATGKSGKTNRVRQIIEDAQIESIEERVGGRRVISELFLHRDKWRDLVDNYKDLEVFRLGIEVVLNEGLIQMEDGDYLTCELTDLGRRVAELAQKRGHLWSQQQKRKLSRPEFALTKRLKRG
jgi:hypothetical protein